VTVRIGLAGCGFIGSVHSFALGQLVAAGLIDAAVTGTYDADPERAAAQAEPHGATVHADLEALLEAVDVVWVCTWTSAHRDVVAAAVERDVAIFCEKPLAPTLAACEEVSRLLELVPHQVGLVLRHAPVVRAAAERVASGRYGRPLATIFRDDQFFPIQGMYDSEWRADAARAGGGTLIEHSIHDIDMLSWLLGEPTNVQARTASMFGHVGIDDVASVTLAYGDGSIASLTSVWHQIMSRPSTRRLEIFCEEAMLWTDDDYLGPLHVETSAGTEIVAGEAPPWVSRFDLPAAVAVPLAQYAEPSKAFLDALAGEGRAATGFPDARIALAAHRLVDLAYRSAAGGGAPLPAESRPR
jgi:UDP-N-acetyl-2-amino-2-deoxyglucuronate dehydrogenase